ncbi:MAG: hypothetical protein ACRDYB_09225 [Acidimicrobiales bacterium]
MTTIVFASGIALLLAPGGSRDCLLLLHKASFIVRIAAMIVHVLGQISRHRPGTSGLGASNDEAK